MPCGLRGGGGPTDIPNSVDPFAETSAETRSGDWFDLRLRDRLGSRDLSILGGGAVFLMHLASNAGAPRCCGTAESIGRSLLGTSQQSSAIYFRRRRHFSF